MESGAASRSSSRTRTGLIVLAVVLGAGLLGCLVCGVSGYLWFQRAALEMREAGARTEAEAEELAAALTQEECRDEALRRADACGEQVDVMCHAQASVFLRVCIDLATPSPGLCDGVPPPDDVMAGARWSADHCIRIGRAGDPVCAQLVSAIVDHCAERRRDHGSAP